VSEGTEVLETVTGTNLPSFESPSSPRLVFGPGKIARVGEFTQQLGGRKVLVVTDSGIVRAGHAAKVGESLSQAGIAFAVYDQVRENPTTLDVANCLELARRENVDFIIGLGGGSSMDTAKGANFLLTNGGEMKDYWGVGKATKPMLPLIAIPTTAGTGSECQSFALIADETTHQKMACGDVKAAAKIALLDPELTVSQPRRVTACTGVDALAHAIESAVTKKRTPISSIYSREAFRLMVEAFPQVLAQPDDIDARGSMLLGAALAGLAIENSMLGAAHSAANPLTAHYGVIHGQAVGVMLPHVVAFNSADAKARETYAELAGAGRLVESWSDQDAAVAALVSHLKQTLVQAELPTDLGYWEVDDAIIPTLAKEAAGQWTAGFNPRTVGEDDFVALYRGALTG
jgi:alcohol dehydrogenase